nr:MAG TPA: hypothetical protein [Caudoviricetes sp.]
MVQCMPRQNRKHIIHILLDSFLSIRCMYRHDIHTFLWLKYSQMEIS